MDIPALYAAFDLFPSPKGAATHIQEMAAALFEHSCGGMLCVLGDDRLPARIDEGKVVISRWQEQIPNFLDRALAFGDHLGSLIEENGASLRLVHYRDPWCGRAVLQSKGRFRFKTIYEVNGMPSIELRDRYSLPKDTIKKLFELEQRCLDEADLIITPAAAVRSYLLSRRTPAQKVIVLSNGAEIPSLVSKPPGLPNRYGVYFGALQQWQGVDNLLRAYSMLSDLSEFSLVICSASHRRVAKKYVKLAEKLGIVNRVEWRFGLPRPALHAIVQHAAVSFAPLADCRRNSVQGCCPLKILESFACGVPVIASRLPAVEELVDDNCDGVLIRPDRPAELARAVRMVLEDPARLKTMGAVGKRKIETHYRWEPIRRKLIDIYRVLETTGRPAYEVCS